MNQEEIVVKDQARNLALTLIVFNEKFDSIIGEINKLSENYSQLNVQQLGTKSDLEFISKNASYKSEIDDARNLIHNLSEDINRTFLKYSINHDHPYSLDSHIHDDQYSNINHTHNYVDLDAYTGYAKSNDSKLQYLTDLSLSTTQSLVELISSNYEKLIKSIQISNDKLDDVSNLFAKSIDSVEYKVDTLKSNTRKDINDLTNIIDDVKNSILKELSITYDEVNNTIDKTQVSVYKEISVLKDKIDNNTEKVKESVTYLKSQIVTSNGSIDSVSKQLNQYTQSNDKELLKLADIKDEILTSLDVIQDKQDTLDVGLSNALSTLKDKAEYSEILLKTDLVKLKKEIIESIPVPKDGKNGEEWEFRPHPTRKGILIFKKQSQKNWNYLDLNHIIPKFNEFEHLNQGGGYIGGGGGASNGLPILWNNILIDSNSSINFVGTGISSVTTSNQVTTVRIQSSGASSSGIGWAVYRDTMYTVDNPLFITGGTSIRLQNNSGTVISTQMPSGVTSFYNNNTGKLTPINIGDYYLFTFRFKAVATVNGAYLDFGVDTGLSTGYIFRQSIPFTKGAGIENVFSIVCPGFTSANFKNSGGLVMITPINGDIDIYSIEFQIDRTYSAL